MAFATKFQDTTTSTSELIRLKKKVEANKKAIEARIAYFKREESRVWRGLQEVRRKAAKFEYGRERILDREEASKTRLDEKIAAFRKRRLYADAIRSSKEKSRQDQTAMIYKSAALKQEAGRQQREVSAQNIHSKRAKFARERLDKIRAAAELQRAAIEARRRIDEQKKNRLARIRQEALKKRLDTIAVVEEAERELQGLEKEEMLWMQRLANSRMTTESILSDLETSLPETATALTTYRMHGIPVERFQESWKRRCELEVEEGSPPPKLSELRCLFN